MDFSRYFPPGVYTETVPGPQIGIQSGAPTSIGIFGVGAGYQSDLQTITVPADITDPAGPANTVPLRQSGIDVSSITVTDVASGAVYSVQTVTSPPDGDYVVNTTTGPSGISNGPDSTVTLTRVTVGTLAAGAQVQVSYQFTDSSYYLPQTIYDFDDVVSRYGLAFNSTGAISSELTLACALAFQNGATSVVTAAVKNSGSPQVSDYANALATFEGMQIISLIVCASGNPSIFPSVKSHVTTQSGLRAERRAILGMDGSVSNVSVGDRATEAAALGTSRVALVSPSAILYPNPITGNNEYIGGQYLAAALAGVSVSQPPAQPLTRKAVTGFIGVDNASDGQKSTETQSGVLVIDSSNQSTALRVRHGVTTDNTSMLAREWSVLGQQDTMAYRIRSYFDIDGIIGSIITELTLANVKSSANSALDSLVSDGVIQAYQALKVRQSPTNIDVVQVSYAWQPSLPLNYMTIQFTLDVTDGATTVSGNTTSV